MSRPRLATGRVEGSLDVRLGAFLLVVAGSLSATAVIATGHAPVAGVHRLVQALALVGMTSIQTFATWRARNEPFLRFAGYALAAALFALLVGLISVAVGAAITWGTWSLTVDRDVQQAAQSWAAVAPVVAWAIRGSR